MVAFIPGNSICKRNDGEERHEDNSLSLINPQNQNDSGTLMEEGTRVLKFH